MVIPADLQYSQFACGLKMSFHYSARLMELVSMRLSKVVRLIVIPS